MFDKIIEFSLKNRVLVLVAYAFLFAYGIQVFPRLSVDVFPDLTKPSVTVLVETGGLAPEEVENLVLIPMENAVNGATGVTRLSSMAAVGYGFVKAEFDWDTDIYRARQIITERISRIESELPDGTEIAMTPISSIMGEILLIGVTSETVSPMALREIAELQIRKRLLSVSGVASVTVVGGDVKQYQILLDTMQMQLLGVTMNDVIEAVEQAGLNGTGGFFMTPFTEELVRAVGRPDTVEDLKNVVIAKEAIKGVPSVNLGQIAEITVAPEPFKRGDAGINGKPGVLISIAKQPEADTIRLTKELDETLTSLEKALPPDVNLEKDLFKQSRFIQHSIDNIEQALLEGAALIAIILFIFLVNFRGTAIVLTVIPCTLIMTAVVFYKFGLSINTMTLGGIAMALGSLIDDSIVDMQNIYKRLRENKKKTSPQPVLRVVFEASKEVRNAIIFSTALIFLVFVPMFAMQGIEGKIFAPLALAFILSMTCSTVVAITLTPVLSSYMLPGVKALGRDRDTLFVRALKALHRGVLHFSFRHIFSVFFAFLLLVGAGVYMVTEFGKEFLPPFNEGNFNVMIVTPPGTNMEESSRIGLMAEKAILTIPEVETTGRKQGRAELDEHALNVNTHEIEVRLRDDLTRSKTELEDDIRHKLDMPGVVMNIGQPMAHRIDFVISGVQAGLVVKIFGPNEEVLSRLTQEVEKIMLAQPGLVDVRRDMQVNIPQMHIRLNREKAVRYGVQVAPAIYAIETALSGRVVSQMFENERLYDIVLRFKGDGRPDMEAVKRIPVMTVYGDHVALGTVADVAQVKGQNEVWRENTTRRMIVQANFANRDAVSTVESLKRRFDQQLTLPHGTFIQIDGQYKTQQDAAKNIAILSLLSFILMFCALQVNFRSLNLATQLMVTIPFSLVGGVVGVFLTSKVISIATIIGMVALVGIAIRNGILLMELYVKEHGETRQKLTPAALVRLTQERLEPVVMTTLTSIIGFIPLIVGGNATGKEILFPVAVVVAFGLVTTTILTLILTPILYYRFGPKTVSCMR